MGQPENYNISFIVMTETLKTVKTHMQDIDLTKRPPRSPRVRLYGYVILPQLLDKCRASIVGKAGEYHYNAPLDQRFFQFTGIDPDALKAQVEKGLGDGEIAQWIEKNSPQSERNGRSSMQHISKNAVPVDNESREFLNEMASGARAAEREDIGTWFEFLDVDDFASYGGKP